MTRALSRVQAGQEGPVRRILVGGESMGMAVASVRVWDFTTHVSFILKQYSQTV